MAGHCGSTMTVICLSHLLLLLIMVDFSIAQGPGKSIPTITDVSAIDNRYLQEDLPLGDDLGQVKAFDPDGTAVSYFIRDNGGEYFAIDQNTGFVTLKKLLDFETEIEIKSVIFVRDQNGQTNQRDCKIFVIDVNDNAPVFTDTAIFRDISEDEKPGFIVTPISVTDRDTVNSQLQVTCGGNTTSFQETCEMFRLVVIDRTNKYWSGNLVLNKTLDYETRNAYNIKLIAYDGVHSVSMEVHIEVVDINDTPPTWGYVGPKNIPEEQPIGTSVQQVNAVDGDLTNKRSIRYELCQTSSSDVFQVDNITGIISNAKRLDYDGTEHERGVPYDICVRAREVINMTTGQLGNDPLTTAAISFRITVDDINDNGPKFSQTAYTVYVDENIATGSNIPGLQMTVTDIDSGTYNSFDLVILNNTDVFGIIPTSDAASSSATIFVTGKVNIDYEAGPKQYIIDVLAIQNFRSPTNPRYPTGSATVTVYVIDVNDVTPTFEYPSYTETVSETASPGTVITTIHATDPEEGDFGTAGIRYRLYGDSTPPHFQIDELTGVVTVAPCNPPNQVGVAPCIDYERKRVYSLTVSATDNKGIPVTRARSVSLVINVLDENDNEPKIDLRYTRYINEDQWVTINPLLIEPVDPDTVGGPLTFTITADQSKLWQVTPMNDSGRLYGNITAIRPIKYRDAIYPDGEFNFAVLVADRKYTTTAYVKIIVIDINDNSPQFIPRNFDVTIPETTKGDVFIVKVTATDADAPTTGNGVIDFSIQSGAQGKFTVTNVTLNVNEFVADIYTTKDAVFNYETQNIYNMVLIARDRGSPTSLYGTANLTVRIIDDNNKDPRIQPSFQSVSVYENEPPGRTVYQVSATDPDVNNKLSYYMTAKEATDLSGDIVSATAYDFTKLFRLDPDTGNVIVNAPLDRDKASRITFELMVVDTNASPQQSGNGTLLIHILEVNDKAPYFDSFPAYEITIDEEMNLNSYVQNLNCQDEDDSIAGYTITPDNPLGSSYFSLLPGSGAMIVSDRIDFEKIERIDLTAICTDAGQPPLSNTTRVIVHIRNINDNSPLFIQNLFQTSVLENTMGGTLNVSVTATDIDKGDYGVVRYRLNDPYGFFSIDNITGIISLLPNVTLDREKVGFLTFQVVAYDSPLNETVRRSSTAQVYLNIGDVNDNCPIFTKPSFVGKVPESADIDTAIMDIPAIDFDEGLNGQIAYTIKTGSGIPIEAENYFGIYRTTGRLFVKTNIKDKIGFYNLTVVATDTDGTLPSIQCSKETSVQIEIQQSNNHAPRWVRPPNRDYAINVLESQYDGMLVYAAKALDDDPGANGVVDYYFLVNNQNISATPEFRINRVTGVIRAEVVFDREQRDQYVLNLLAKDRGDPSSSSETTLIVLILDVNDNNPVFATKNGVVEPLRLSVPEGTQNLPYSLGTCNATDADSNVENNRIYYDLLAARNEIKDYISVDNITCAIYVIKAIDFEKMPVIMFDILAYNQKNDDSVKRYKREVNRSIQPVIILVGNSNDNPPVFLKTSYTECVSIDAPLQQNIVQVSATDVDGGASSSITYSISATREFKIDQNGYISNLISFRDSSNSQRTYNLNVFASDGSKSATAMVTIFVTSNDNTAVLTVNQPLTDVLTFKQQIKKVLMDSPNGRIGYACVVDVKKHVNEDGQPSTVSSDVYVAAFKNSTGQYIPYSSSELTNYINDLRKSGYGSALDTVYVTGAKEESKSDKFILEEDAVLAVLIICILLLFLALLLLCIACICIRNSDKKKKNNIKAASHTIVHVQEPLETSINPVYNVGQPAEFEREPVEYTTVKKVRPVATAISPVVVPSPMPVDEDSFFSPVEPPRVYSQDADLEPVIETEVEPEPFIETEVEPEPFIETEIEPEPFIETEVEPSPIYETDLEPEPVFETLIERAPTPEPGDYSPRHFPEYEERLERIADDDDYETPVVPRVSFPESVEEIEEPISTYFPPPSPAPSFSRMQPDYDSN
ncbi:hypothetical protein BsWGS_20832 [Bradybaena similaris]